MGVFLDEPRTVSMGGASMMMSKWVSCKWKLCPSSNFSAPQAGFITPRLRLLSNLTGQHVCRHLGITRHAVYASAGFLNSVATIMQPQNANVITVHSNAHRSAKQEQGHGSACAGLQSTACRLGNAKLNSNMLMCCSWRRSMVEGANLHPPVYHCLAK